MEAVKTHLSHLGLEATDAAIAGYETSVADRVAQLGIDATALSYTVRKLCKYIWPGKGTPIVLAELAHHLALAPAAVEELQELATRAGALWTVSLLKSWYLDGDLELLKEGFRDDDSYEALKERLDIPDAACTIADFVDLAEFIPNRPAARSSDDEEADDGEEIEARGSKGKAVEEAGFSKTDPARVVDVASSSKATE